mmetsp:Transcript_11414/g.26381  ORF Transcript_11414/g.26381 Transcript_11414/m.26381 type:complete len:207 (+) Transcript_11414:31-651(+)
MGTQPAERPLTHPLRSSFCRRRARPTEAVAGMDPMGLVAHRKEVVALEGAKSRADQGQGCLWCHHVETYLHPTCQRSLHRPAEVAEAVGRPTVVADHIHTEVQAASGHMVVVHSQGSPVVAAAAANHKVAAAGVVGAYHSHLVLGRKAGTREVDHPEVAAARLVERIQKSLQSAPLFAPAEALAQQGNRHAVQPTAGGHCCTLPSW